MAKDTVALKLAWQKWDKQGQFGKWLLQVSNWKQRRRRGRRRIRRKGERTNRIRMAAYIYKHFVGSPNKESALSPVSSFKRCKEQTYFRRYSWTIKALRMSVGWQETTWLRYKQFLWNLIIPWSLTTSGIRVLLEKLSSSANRRRLSLICHKIRTAGELLEHGVEPSGNIKYWNFLTKIQ